MKHILQSKWRSLTFLSLVMVSLGLATLSLTDAFARPQRVSRNSPSASVTRTPVYNPGNFTFASTKQLLPGPPTDTLGFQDVEPEIKIDIYGNIYIGAIEGVPAGVDLWKSTDQGATFAYLGQPDGAQCPAGQTCTSDAGVGGGDDSIDVSPGGYLYVSSLWLGSVTMSASYDGGTGGVLPGQKWEVNPVAANIPADDRQWVAAYGPQTVYMAYRQTLPVGVNATNVIFVAKSTDGGKTFPQQVATFQPTSLVTARREGNLVVDPYNGNLYTSFRPQELNGHTRAELWLLKSTDGGQNWSMSQIYQGPTGSDIGNIFPVMAVDRGGNVHIAFSQCDYNSVTQNSSNCSVYLMSSADQGASWLNPVKVNNGPDTSYAILPWIVAGSPGVVDITWYGSNITTSTQAASWHLYFSQVTNAMADTPVFNQVQAIPQVVHNQDICLKGGACGGNRALAEYYQIALDAAGNANIAFTDTVTNNTTGAGRTWFTKQSGGASAYSPPAGPPAATFATNVPLPNSGGGAEPSFTVDNFNCMYASAPGGGNIWKSVNNGASFAKLPDVPIGPAGGGDEDLITLPSATRPTPIYYIDLQLADVDIRKSTDGGASWFSPGVAGSAGEFNASSDRQWIAYDFNGANTNIYEMDHELASEDIRFASSTNDSPWATTSGITDPGLLSSTAPNTNPGPVFVNLNTHTVYGVFTSSIPRNNADRPPFGKLPDVWVAVGAGTAMAGLPPGPFTDYPAFKGVIDSPATPAPPAGSVTYGSNAANDFPAGDIDRAGNVYVAWAMNNARTNQYNVWMSVSHDGGQNFYGPFQVSSGPGSAEMPWVAAGDAGKIDIVYYQTNELGDPNSTNLHWNTMMAQSLNANSREPVFTVSQVSDHIMHFGPICNQGLLCNSGTRELLDYFEIAIGPDGLANMVYTDTGNANTPSHVTFARQIGGALALNSPSSPSCLASSSIIPVNAVSRKTHGAAGDFDVTLPLTGNPGIECRSGGANGDYKVLINFANTVTIGGASVASADGQAIVSSSNVSGPVVTVNLTHVHNAQTITISLTNVSDNTNTGNVSVPMGVLAGDTNADRSVNSADISQTKSQSGQPVTGTNFREDVNTDGNLNSADIGLVKSKSGTGL